MKFLDSIEQSRKFGFVLPSRVDPHFDNRSRCVAEKVRPVNARDTFARVSGDSVVPRCDSRILIRVSSE